MILVRTIQYLIYFSVSFFVIFGLSMEIDNLLMPKLLKLNSEITVWYKPISLVIIVLLSHFVSHYFVWQKGTKRNIDNKDN